MYYFSEYLKESFNRILEYPLTVVEAGAGCGKSTAVSEYFLKQVACDCRQLYYTCLGELPQNAWSGICIEFGRIDEQVGQYLHSMMVPDKENIGNIAAQLRYLQCDEETVLCIDNYQLFDIPYRGKLVEAFSLHACEKLHIVIITQPLSQEDNRHFNRFPSYCISAESLYFAQTDIFNYFKQEGIRLKKKDLDTVWNITEGYVAAISLQLESWKYYGHFEISSHIFILMERILWSCLSQDEKKCLLCLGTVEAFTLRQGAEMNGNTMSLDELQKFLDGIDFIKYDRSSSRYLFHHLLLVFVRDKFHDLPEGQQEKIWKQAAKACENNKEYLLAAKLYGKCGDFHALVELPFGKDDRVELVRMENGNIVSRLIQPLQRNLLYKNPELALSLTLELYIQGKIMLHVQYLEVVKEILEKLADYGEQRGANLRGEYCLLESFLAFNDVQKMCDCHRQAWSYMKRPTQLYSLNTAWTFGMPSVVGMFWRESGKLEQEFREVRDGMPLYYKLVEGNGMGAHHAMEGEIYLLQGDDKSAEESYHKALYAAESMEQDSICYCAYLGMARMAVFGGNVATYTHMQENIDDRPYLGKDDRCIFTTDVCKGYLSILLEEFQEVPDWLWHSDEIESRALMPTRPFMHNIYCRLLLERMKKREISYEKFKEKVHKWVEECRKFHMLLPEVYNWIYFSIGAQMVGKQTEAEELLRIALQICLEDNLVIPFVENYGLLQGLLRGMLLRGAMQNMRKRIIDLGERFLKGRKVILSALHVTDKILTQREHEIAVLLKERFSVKEIAAKLHIAPSTVSNTMQSIYSKLGIHSKRELYHREDI